MAASDGRGQEEDGIKRFDPRILDRSVIAIPLLEAISKDENQVHSVIIDVNLDYDEGRDAGRKWIREAIKNAIAIVAPSDEKQGVREKKSDLSNQYIFARLSGRPRPWQFGLRPTRFWPSCGIGSCRAIRMTART